MNQQKPLEYLLQALSPEEQLEFQQAVSYLSEMTANEQMPEGSISAVLARLSPNVQATFKTLSDTLETPRIAPFQPKMSETDYAEAFDADAGMMSNIKQRIDQDFVVNGLQRRMPPDQPSDAPPTRREQIEAALRAHTGGQ